MHAEHADSERLNDLSGRVNGCAFPMVGEYSTDLFVEGMLLVELKTVRELGDVPSKQCTNHLQATGLALCLLLDFGKPNHTCGPRPMSSTKPSACSACIFCHLR
jgi:hypothetical protein